MNNNLNNIQTPNRNGTIEFLRFLFAIMIALFHSNQNWESSLFNGHISIFFRGAIGVEFFLLVSGFLMAKTAYNNSLNEKNEIGEDTAKFIWKKYKSIFPYHLYAFILCFIIDVLLRHYSLKETVYYAIFSIPDLFLYYMAGFFDAQLNLIEWYISAMFIVMLILYPLAQKNFKCFVNIIAPLIVLFIFGWLSYTYGSLTGIRFYRHLL